MSVNFGSLAVIVVDMGEKLSKELLARASNRFGFLKAMQELRNKPVSTIKSLSERPGHWVHHLEETPTMYRGLEFWTSLGVRAFAASEGDAFAVVELVKTAINEARPVVLKVPRPSTSRVPELSHNLGPWLDCDIDDPYSEPQLLSEITIENEDESISTTLYLASSPEIESEFRTWLVEWRAWADETKRKLPWQRLYEKVFDARTQILQSPEDWELVFALGRLKLSDQLDRHLFTVACMVDIDENGTLYVRRDDLAAFRVEDEWLATAGKPKRESLMAIAQQLTEEEGTAFNSINDSLVQLAYSYRSSIQTDADPDVDKAAESLRLFPSLILRKRGDRELIDLLDALETQLKQPEQEIPGALKVLLDPTQNSAASSGWSEDGAVVGIEEDQYLPLALNKHQRRALLSADSKSATLVQGPPGTGKTRTIAVMVSHFLAKGQRVLVAAETSQALREVRNQLPDEIRSLAVSKVGQKGDKDDLAKAVNALNRASEDRYELVEQFAEREKRLIEEIHTLHKRRAEQLDAILSIRRHETETLDLAGMRGTPAQLARLWLEQREKFGWIESITTPNSPGPELDALALDNLRSLLHEGWEIKPSVTFDERMPKASEILDPDAFRRLVNFMKLTPPAGHQLPPGDLKSLERLTREGADLDSRLRDVSWTSLAVKELLENSGGTNTSAAKRVAAQLAKVQDLLAGIDEFEGITCGPTNQEWLPLLSALRTLIQEKGDLRTNVRGAWKVPIIGSSVLRKAQDLLGEVRIKGQAIRSERDVESIRRIVELDFIFESVSNSRKFEPEPPNSRQERYFWLEAQARVAADFSRFEVVVKELRDRLSIGELDLPKLSQQIDYAVLAAEAKSVDGLRKSFLRSLTSSSLPTDPALLEQAVHAITNNDPDEYQSIFSKLHAYCGSVEDLTKLDNRLVEVVRNDSAFIETCRKWLLATPGPEKDSVLEHVEPLLDALRFKRLAFELQKQASPRYAEHFSEIQKLDAQIEDSMRDLARRRAWKKALDRIDDGVLSLMSRYERETRRLGKGTGKRAPQIRREIRSYLDGCIPAIPAWIMPISEVARTFPHKLRIFDVVIVDEASQASLPALFLLALADRVVVVGDHKQVSPASIGTDVNVVASLADRYLEGDSCRANWQNPNLSLFDECKSSFVSSMITLTEHRRCVPEIIGFSNQIAYLPDNIRLVPVRQTGSDALVPIETVYLPDGYAQGSDSAKLTNRPEAEAIVDRLVAMTMNTKYDDMTFGVIALQGSAQAELIQRMALERLGAGEFEKRQLMFGMPPAFQGAERNVILLSMVAARNKKSVAQTTEQVIQRYNVAISRARDQIVLFHSLKSEDLGNPQDLRKQLLEYCSRIERGLTNQINGAVGIVPEDVIVPPFATLFEQRVHNRIVERGYTVVPQFKPEIEGHEYSIDLVVIGRHGKFAVECDGDAFHTSSEDMRNDFIRQSILMGAGWRFFRLPESEFYRNPNALDELWPELEGLGIPSAPERKRDSEEIIDWDEEAVIDENGLPEEEDVADSPSTPDRVSATGTPQVHGDFGTPPNRAPRLDSLDTYSRWSLPENRTLVRIASGSTSIWRDLLDIVETEGPMLGGFLMRRHYKLTGGSSLSSANEAAYSQHLRTLMDRGELIADDFDETKKVGAATFRRPSQAAFRVRERGDRDLYDIPPRELFELMRLVYFENPNRTSNGDYELLLRRTLEVLAFTKLTKKANEHLISVLARFSEGAES